MKIKSKSLKTDKSWKSMKITGNVVFLIAIPFLPSLLQHHSTSNTIMQRAQAIVGHIAPSAVVTTPSVEVTAGVRKAPIRVCVTGAAGQIAYSLIPMIGNGKMFGISQPVVWCHCILHLAIATVLLVTIGRLVAASWQILHLLDIPPMETALQGVIMEVEDCAFPVVKGCLHCHGSITSTIKVLTELSNQTKPIQTNPNQTKPNQSNPIQSKWQESWPLAIQTLHSRMLMLRFLYVATSRCLIGDAELWIMMWSFDDPVDWLIGWLPCQGRSIPSQGWYATKGSSWEECGHLWDSRQGHRCCCFAQCQGTMIVMLLPHGNAQLHLTDEHAGSCCW
jgi:hypothetical protein